MRSSNAPTGVRETYFATMPGLSFGKQSQMPSLVSQANQQCAWSFGVRIACNRAIGNLQMKLTGKPVLLGSDKATEILAESWTCSSEKMARTWGMKCEDDLDAVVGKTYRFYKDQRWI
ncbi:MAG: hypothetical protein IPP40_15595 [bacterium]|nr:hypothetical protein [bacterium]